MVQSVDDLGTGFEKNVQYYEESITRNTVKLNAMIEPLIMVFLAGMVLVFLLALYPSFNWVNGFELNFMKLCDSP